ncbi:MAG: hypothetical protein ACLGIC_00510 [Acidimicrobiia bacterium]
MAAAVATGVLALVHVALPALRRRLSGAPEGLAASVAGGVAIAYVFVHLLPEVAQGNREVAHLLGEHLQVTELEEVLLFLVALSGFLALYGLDHVAEQRRDQDGVFATHLGAFALYNALITYALPTRFRTDAGAAVLFVFAMGIHFLLSDRNLAEHYGARFRRVGRPVLVAALWVGYLLALVFAPTSAVVVSTMLALLAGFVLYNVFSDELPSSDRLRFPLFLGSAVLYAGVLVAITAATA